jgi:hypothetical protein
MMTPTLKRLLWALLVVVAVGGLVVAYLFSRQAAGREAESEKPIKAPLRVTTDNGEAAVKLDPAGQRLNTLDTAPLVATAHRTDVRAAGGVADGQPLIDGRNTYREAQTTLEKARAAAEVSRRAYERLHALYLDERNASAKTVEAAEGTMRSDAVAVRGAEDALALNADRLRQQWGEAVAQWIITGSAEFQRVATLQDVLVQVMLPPGASLAPPPTASLELSMGGTESARFVSAFPHPDPRIQSPSYLYVARSRVGLTPGANVVVRLASGAAVDGVTVPLTAIVWWQGKAWTYVQTATDTFARREVTTETPLGDGWFIPANAQDPRALRSGQRVVIAGAQQLLSEEFRSQIQGGG